MHLPFVPYRGFLRLAGPGLTSETDRLLARPNVLGLVLLSDATGNKLALVPVGPGEEYARFEDVAGRQTGGLRPCCGLRVEDVRQAEERARREERLAAREAALADREREVERMERQLSEIVRTLTENGIDATARTPQPPPARQG